MARHRSLPGSVFALSMCRPGPAAAGRVASGGPGRTFPTVKAPAAPAACHPPDVQGLNEGNGPAARCRVGSKGAGSNVERLPPSMGRHQGAGRTSRSPSATGGQVGLVLAGTPGPQAARRRAAGGRSTWGRSPTGGGAARLSPDADGVGARRGAPGGTRWSETADLPRRRSPGRIATVVGIFRPNARVERGHRAIKLALGPRRVPSVDGDQPGTD